MINYNKYILCALVFSFTFISYGKDRPFIQTKTKKILAERITSDTKGRLTYKVKTLQMKLKPEEYIYARVPMPREITSALRKLQSKQYTDAANGLKQAYDKYRFLGWDVFCLYYIGAAYEKAGKIDMAVKELEKIKEFPKDPSKKKDYYSAKKLLATLYIKKSEYEKAEKTLSAIGEADYSDIFAFVNNSRGDIFKKQGKKKDAMLMYLRTVMLCTKENNKKERPEALVKVIEILKEDNNNRHLDFEKILKADYPGFSM
jgi:predicted negative regulator of RcsB-dependent stress response